MIQHGNISRKSGEDPDKGTKEPLAILNPILTPA